MARSTIRPRDPALRAVATAWRAGAATLCWSDWPYRDAGVFREAGFLSPPTPRPPPPLRVDGKFAWQLSHAMLLAPRLPPRKLCASPRLGSVNRLRGTNSRCKRKRSAFTATRLLPQLCSGGAGSAPVGQRSARLVDLDLRQFGGRQPHALRSAPPRRMRRRSQHAQATAVSPACQDKAPTH